jgi:hypothetical protein
MNDAAAARRHFRKYLDVIASAQSPGTSTSSEKPVSS